MKGQNKIRTIIIGAALLAVLILTGTYAWTQFNQGAFAPAWADWNVFGGQYGGRMHHDFEDRDGAGNYDSDIYAENFGEENLFVRVQLREFYSVNGVSIDGAVVNDPTTWPIYRSMPNDANLRYTGGGVYAIGEEGVITTLGDTAGNKVFMPSFNHATIPTDDIDPAVPNPFNIREAYRFTTTTGRAVDAIADLFSISSITGAPDVYNNGVQTGPTVANGTHNFWNIGDTYDGNLIYIDEITGYLSTRPETHVARATIEPDYGGIMTWTQWDYQDRPEGNFWIHDDTDPNGWFYWNGNLPAGEATSLLMRDVYLPDRPEAWEYIVTLNADFFTHDSIDDLYPAVTDNASEILYEGIEATITFHDDEGGIEVVNVITGQRITNYPVFEDRYGEIGNPGQYFVGWFEKENPIHFGNLTSTFRDFPIDFSNRIRRNMLDENNNLNLYAAWLDYGDVNGDGVITSADLFAIQRIIAEHNIEVVLQVADVNVDGVIDDEDAELIQRFIAAHPVILGRPRPE